MTPRFLSTAANPFRLAHRRQWDALLVSAAVSALVTTCFVGCGGQATDPLGSTDTGNPPVIAETKLRVMAADDGVVVSGAKGAVSAGSDVEVTNLSTNESVQTTASDDGSFEVELAGSPSDAYQVEATKNGKSARKEIEPAASDVDLEGHEFLLQTAMGYQAVEGTTISVSFDEGGLRFSAGCNSHAGAYTLCDDALCVDGLSSTEIGCDQALHTQDEWLADFFMSKPSVEYAPPVLTLTSGDVKLDFLDKDEADPDRPLTGRIWTFDTVILNDSASNLPFEKPATIEFAEGGTFEAFDTCNTLTGAYVVEPSVLRFADVITTDAACDADDAGFRQLFADFLGTASSYTIEANRLTLTHPGLGLSAITE